MKCWNENVTESKNIYDTGNRKHMLQYTLSEQISHGMDVSNLAYDVAHELGLEETVCHELAIAGILHDVGKIVLMGEFDEQENPLVVEEIRFVRMHAAQSYEVAKAHGYSEFIQESILYHHENFDGSGYPYNLSGYKIPFGARILRVCDVYCALTSDRPYRKAFDRDVAVELMIDDIKDFDVGVFLAFQRVLHEKERTSVKIGELTVNERGEIE